MSRIVIVVVGIFFLGGVVWLSELGRLLATSSGPSLHPPDQPLVTRTSTTASSARPLSADTATTTPTRDPETLTSSALLPARSYLPLLVRVDAARPTSTARAAPTTPIVIPPTTTTTPLPPTPTATLIPSPLNQTGTQWGPYLEWSLTNPTYTGNPYDLVASVVFTHTLSGETRRTEMFYAGADIWKFRFTGTRPGIWYFGTTSDDPDLDGQSGGVLINPNPDPLAQGFVVARGSKWARSATGDGFVPQYVMYPDPDQFAGDPARIDADIRTFLHDHGFTGFHVQVYCRWFDLETKGCTEIAGDDPNPDPRTFAALELLISRTYAAGGVVHLWMWGDDERGWNPKRWGLNGPQDQRLQRYIAARLGPLPGWTMGYGFDLFEWVTGPELAVWHTFMHDHFGWSHLLGARASTNQLDQLTEVLDYASYEQHEPDYALYVETIDARPDKPAFSADRFRITDGLVGPGKSYTFAQMRRGLWHSAMAGGVANIWGNLEGERDSRDGSLPFPNAAEIKTYATFFQRHFTPDLVRCNELTSGVCLQRPTDAHYLFYQEQTAVIEMSLMDMLEPQPAVAIDTHRPYAEISLGTLSPETHVWEAPYVSDWAIAVGDF